MICCLQKREHDCSSFPETPREIYFCVVETHNEGSIRKSTSFKELSFSITLKGPKGGSKNA